MILVGIDIAKDKHECFIRTLEVRSGLKPLGITPTAFWVSYSAKSWQLLYLIPCKQVNSENHLRSVKPKLTK